MNIYGQSTRHTFVACYFNCDFYYLIILELIVSFTLGVLEYQKVFLVMPSLLFLSTYCTCFQVMQLQAETVFLCTLYELKASSFLPSGSYDKEV